jgi:hypothetical protein
VSHWRLITAAKIAAITGVMNAALFVKDARASALGALW